MKKYFGILALLLFLASCSEDETPVIVEDINPQEEDPTYSLYLIIPTDTIEWVTDQAIMNGSLATGYTMEAVNVGTSGQTVLRVNDLMLTTERQTTNEQDVRLILNGTPVEFAYFNESNFQFVDVNTEDQEVIGFYECDFVQYFYIGMGTATVTRSGFLRANFADVKY